VFVKAVRVFVKSVKVHVKAVRVLVEAVRVLVEAVRVLVDPVRVPLEALRLLQKRENELQGLLFYEQNRNKSTNVSVSKLRIETKPKRFDAFQ
jgi:hypothetical protein